VAKRASGKDRADPAAAAFLGGRSLVSGHPVFRPLTGAADIRREKGQPFPHAGLAVSCSGGQILCNPNKRAKPEEWARAIAHALLHLGMGHFRERPNFEKWNHACDCVIEKFLTDLRFGKPLTDAVLPSGIGDEEALFERMLGMKDTDLVYYEEFGTAGRGVEDMIFTEQAKYRYYGANGQAPMWDKLFAEGLSDAVRSAVNVASGLQESLVSGEDETRATQAGRVRQWFISSYPLLGAVASSFKLVEDPLVCQRMSISIAAISPTLGEIYINPAAKLSLEEKRFVMAHEFLHAALRHDARLAWRDPYLWNVACDYVVNGWLTEMGVGERPEGVLYDDQLNGLNAEAVYDRIVTDMRTYRKLATLRGIGLGDMLPGSRGALPDQDLDAFYRRALSQGLDFHQEQSRGYLPAGLVEEIRALGHPPIPWDVELARWFDDQFTPIEKIRTYARPSRRQSSTPDIPRPNWAVSQASLDGRTFGVILDTSGSMERSLLATALGAVASYSASRDVPAARVVFCDAEAYDQGYMKPEDIAGSVKVRGRGGTILQPGIDRLLAAEDFPGAAPLLVITDGYCEDRLVFRGREHAFLLPAGARLPFVPKGKVFRFR
jgi:predicted metal-dependent peptidase